LWPRPSFWPPSRCSPRSKGTSKRTDEEDVIKVSANLVNFDVMVKDKKGKAITDSKAEDFILFENVRAADYLVLLRLNSPW
jgi:hypothetical protein